MLTADRLRELLHYDPETGVFTWRVKKHRANIGDRAGTPNGDGYLVTKIDQKMYRAHRLAWLYVHGRWPKNEVDHINGARDDNRILNLRDATRAQNAHNSKAPKRNTTGVKGVRANSRGHGYEGLIMVRGRQVYVGQYNTVAEAALAVSVARKALHGEFARNG